MVEARIHFIAAAGSWLRCAEELKMNGDALNSAINTDCCGRNRAANICNNYSASLAALLRNGHHKFCFVI